MPTYAVLPASLTLRCFKGDEFAVVVDVDTDLTGYTFATDIFRITQQTVAGGGLTSTTTSFDTFGLTVLSYPLGRLRLSLTESQTANKTGSYRFILRWVAPGDVTRTVLNGEIEFVPDLSLSSGGTSSDGSVITVSVADTLPSGSLPVATGAAALLGELVWG